MLVLSRRCGQRILVGDDVVVTIVSMGSNRVRIGIQAPSEIGVDRHEVWTQSGLESGSSSPRTSHDHLDL